MLVVFYLVLVVETNQKIETSMIMHMNFLPTELWRPPYSKQKYI